MPEETTTAPPAEETPAAPPDAEQPSDDQKPGDWFRETALGLTTRPLEVTDRKQQWDEANAELRRGKRGNAEADPKSEEQAQQTEPDQKSSEETTSRPERDEKDLERRVQAEVDRREAVRRQRLDSQRERELRQRDPEAYAKLKEQQEQQNAQAGNLSNAMRSLATMFDDAAITPLVQSLPEKVQAEVTKDAGHGLDGRKVIVSRAIEALKKAAHDEGYAKGRAEAQKSLRKSSSFRKELLSELRDTEDEPELAPGNGSSNGSDFDMNDFMRGALGRRTRVSTRE